MWGTLLLPLYRVLIKWIHKVALLFLQVDEGVSGHSLCTAVYYTPMLPAEYKFILSSCVLLTEIAISWEWKLTDLKGN